jgi:hypothetical protein
LTTASKQAKFLSESKAELILEMSVY